MRGSWRLTKTERLFYTALIKHAIKKLKTTDIYEYDLTNYPLNPYQVQSIMEDLGYCQGYFETNGWEQDCWCEFTKEDEPTITVASCGMTFDLHLIISDDN